MPVVLPDAVYGEGRVRRVVLDGVVHLCVVDLLTALGYAKPDRDVRNVKRLKGADGRPSTVEVMVSVGGSMRGVLFLSEIDTVRFVMRSHAASHPGSSQYAFVMAFFDRMSHAGNLVASDDAAERRVALVEQALRLSDARNARLASENMDLRRVASRSRKEVQAAQDEALVARDRARPSGAIGHAGRQDAQASRDALSKIEGELEKARRRIADLQARIAVVETNADADRRKHSKNVAVLKLALAEKTELADAAMSLFPDARLAEILKARKH